MSEVVEFLDEVLEFLNFIYELTPECRLHLEKVVKFKRVPKGEVLLEMGEVNRHLYFIRSGALHCYYYVKDRTVSDWFFLENATVVSIGSFYDQVPSEDYIVALEDCELLYITKEDYDFLNWTYLEFNFIARVLLEKYLKIFHAHARMIRKTAAADRYQFVLKKMPELVQRIQVGDLATWLNMEPSTLSRVRGHHD
jgi:CRP/FNR family transcriptional regulator, anaerobic regulatory protein